MTNSRYLILVSSFALTIFVLVGGANYLVNPFEIMNVARIHGVNDYKPEAADRIWTYKKYQPVFYRPELLLIGNSRIEMGLDPDSQYFESYRRVYNLGTPGVGLKEQLYMGQRVVDTNSVKTIIISLDFLDFLKRPNYVAKQKEFRTRPIYDRFAALWSLDALFASFTTLINQNEFNSNRLENGFNPAKDYIPIIRHEGQAVLFKQTKNSLLQKLAGKQWNIEYAYQNQHSELMTLLRQIKAWQSRQIEVFAFINPYHQVYYKGIDESLLTEDFLNWREMLKNTLSETIKFCDFTDLGYEKSDERLNERELKYFWEPAHYKKELGDIMIPKILKGC